MPSAIPSTRIVLFKNIPFARNYSNTLWFTSLQEQINFFSNYSPRYEVENCIYQKQNKTIKVNMTGQNSVPFEYNYLMFVNDDGMRFYCFIDDVIYLSQNCYEFSFTFDILQTYMQFIDFHPTFIAREHVNNDTKGYNTVAEDFSGLGQYVYESLMTPFVGDPNVPSYPQEIALFNADSNMIVFACTFKITDLSVASGIDYLSQIDAGMKNEAFTGLNLICFTTEQVESAVRFVSQCVEEAKDSGIVTMFMCPQGALYQEINSDRRGSDFTLYADNTKLGAYTPRNNKLYTYPFNFVYVTNNEGNGSILKFEYFSGYEQNFGKIDFCMDSLISCNPVVGMFPRNYEGILYNYNEIITTSSYPTCAWSTDIFKAYIAQNSGKLLAGAVNLGIDTVQGIAGGITQGVQGAALAYATGGVLGVGQIAGGTSSTFNTVVDTAQNVISTIGNMHDIKILPPQAHGNDTSSLNVAMKVKGFEVFRCHINSETARIIDNYFDMFGYAVKTVKMPNLTGRKNWNFVKTVNCSVTGRAPASVLDDIGKIFDAGITLWHNLSNYDNYSADNSII